MVNHRVGDDYNLFVSLEANGAETVGISQGWIEAALIGEYLKVRAGKLYRRFGIYNELLDAAPTYIGIEPPEIFDGDHLMLTRTTNAVVHGQVVLGEKSHIAYAAMTGSDERAGGEVPIGLDLRYEMGSTLMVGTSFYSTNGDAVPTHGVGDGSPGGGFATWMERDQYMVYGGFATVGWSGIIGQVAHYRAQHEGWRDPDQVALLEDAGLNNRQRERFGLDSGSIKRRSSYEGR